MSGLGSRQEDVLWLVPGGKTCLGETTDLCGLRRLHPPDTSFPLHATTLLSSADAEVVEFSLALSEDGLSDNAVHPFTEDVLGTSSAPGARHTWGPGAPPLPPDFL